MRSFSGSSETGVRPNIYSVTLIIPISTPVDQIEFRKREIRPSQRVGPRWLQGINVGRARMPNRRSTTPNRDYLLYDLYDRLQRLTVVSIVGNELLFRGHVAQDLPRVSE
jgi:hypothetical protein